MSGFHEVRLALPLALGATGGPERRTDVVQLSSGAESRNARWARSRRRWEIGGAVLRIDEAQELLAFFEARQGRLHGFRFRDPIDWKSCPPASEITALDQVIGTGDGEATDFQLVKRYGDEEVWIERTIRKPVDDAVVVAIEGEVTADFSVDLSTGMVTLAEPAPEGATVTAGFAFDVPVRFDADRLELALAGNGVVRVVRAPLIEITD